jgi:hypothetical protein
MRVSQSEESEHETQIVSPSGNKEDMSPIASIEQIARSEDRARAIVFFLFFARFEYALKRAGFTQEREEAMADWEKYAHSGVADLVAKNNKELLKAAVDLLQSKPPRKQVVSEGRLDFSADRYMGSFGLARIFVLVCRVANESFSWREVSKRAGSGRQPRPRAA